MKSKDEQLKFVNDTDVTVILLDQEKDDYGKIIQSIEPLPDGYTWFAPAKGLIKKMVEEGVGLGDQIKIGKVNDPAYEYPYFTLDVLHKAIKKKEPVVEETQPEPVVHKSVEKFEAQFNTEEPDRKTQHDIMWKWYQGETAEKGHKEGDELF